VSATLTEEPAVLTPSAAYRPPTDEELDLLRQIGEHWAQTLGGRRLSRARLPADPDLVGCREPLPPISRYERLVRVVDEGFVPARPGTVVASEGAIRPPSRLGRMVFTARRALLGPPLATTAIVQERLSKVVALAVLTVAVSVAAGVAAVTSALPALEPLTVELGVGLIALILAANLRGIRQSGTLFAVPTYAFVAGILLLIAVGVGHAAMGGWRVAPPPRLPTTEALAPLLLLRAFASGCSAMTGIEAIADGIPAFRPPEWRNARTTLTWMIGLLVVMFAGITLLTRLDGLVPSAHETILSQLAAHTFGRGVLYGYIQAATSLILVLAANTAFSDFPRLLFFLARDRYAPRLFLRMGDRLAYSNGIVVLGVVAAGLLVAFHGRTDRLISLYAIGVFLSFTLSQSGMTVRWWRRREAGWARSLPVNALGATLSGTVLLIIAVSKFTQGAWVIVLVIPLIITLLSRIRRHYAVVERATALHPPSGKTGHLPLLRARREVTDGARPAPEQVEAPDEIRHLVVVPVAWLDLPALRALAYAVSLSLPVLALHVATDDEDARRLRTLWSAWGDHVPLEVIVSPYRVVVAPAANYVRALHRTHPDLTITAVLPELAVTRWWHQLLHNQVALRLRRLLRLYPGTVVTSVPFHLPKELSAAPQPPAKR
jgi:amino acid transporter